MSLEELIERRHHGKILPKKMPLSQQIKRSVYLLISTLLSIIVLLGIVFLQNSSQSSQKGIIWKQEQRNQANLDKENRKLTDKITEAEALKTLENSGTITQMQKIEDPTYIGPKGKKIETQKDKKTTSKQKSSNNDNLS